MAEVQMKVPDPEEETERRARAEKRNAEAKVEAFRMQSLTLAVQWASTETWSGNSAGVVAAAQVFEHYLTTGTSMDTEAYGKVYEAVRESGRALRG